VSPKAPKPKPSREEIEDFFEDLHELPLTHHKKTLSWLEELVQEETHTTGDLNPRTHWDKFYSQAHPGTFSQCNICNPRDPIDAVEAYRG
jgi:hypothetical protein